MEYTSIQELNLSLEIAEVFEINLSLLILNVICYVAVLFLIFSIIFLFDTSKFKTLNDLKGFGNLQFLFLSIIFSFLSLASIPPFLGFCGKLLMFFLFFFKKHLLVTFVFSLINFFVIYFYIQNLRFLVSKNQSTFFFYKNFFCYLDFNVLFLITLLNFINIFGLFFIHDFIIIIQFFMSYINIS